MPGGVGGAGSIPVPTRFVLAVAGSIGRWASSVQHPLGFRLLSLRRAGIQLHQSRLRRAGYWIRRAGISAHRLKIVDHG